MLGLHLVPPLVIHLFVIPLIWPPLTIRRHELLSVCEDINLLILNGLEGIQGSHTGSTSFQSAQSDAMRCSVIDFCLLSQSSFGRVQFFDVLGHTLWSDHAPLLLHFSMPSLVTAVPDCTSSISSHSFPPSPTANHLDDLVCSLHDSQLSPLAAGHNQLCLLIKVITSWRVGSSLRRIIVATPLNVSSRIPPWLIWLLRFRTLPLSGHFIKDFHILRCRRLESLFNSCITPLSPEWTPPTPSL